MCDTCNLFKPRLKVIIKKERNPKAENDDPAPQISLDSISKAFSNIFGSNFTVEEED